jgi:hypothetical protein
MNLRSSIVLSALASIALPPVAEAQFGVPVNLYIDQLGAEVQTEHGIDEDDEIYFIVSVTNSAGQVISQPTRVPAAYIEIQEGNTLRLDSKLHGGWVMPGDWQMVHVQMMEDDSSDLLPVINAIQQILGSAGNLGCQFGAGPACALPAVGNTLGQIAGAVTASSGDDFLGSFNAVLWNNAGFNYAHFQSGPGMSLLPGWQEGWVGTAGWLFLNEVDARYWATFSLR